MNELWVQGGVFLHSNNKPLIATSPKTQKCPQMESKHTKIKLFHELSWMFYEKNENGIKGKKRCLPLHGSAKQHQKERKMVSFDDRYQISNL